MSKSGLRRDQNRATLYLLLPGILTILIFTTIPAITTLSYSLFDWTGFQRGEFIGFDNFLRLSEYPFKDQFLMALRHNTLVFIAVMLLQTSLGLLVAYALFKVIRGRRIYRTIVFLPVIFSLVIVGYMWQTLLDPFYGPINQILMKVGLTEWALPWLGDTRTALS